MSSERIQQAALRLAGDKETGWWPGDITLCRAGSEGDRVLDAEPLVALLHVIASRPHNGDPLAEDNAECWDCWRPLWAGHEAECVVGAAEVLADAIMGDE